MKKIKLTQGKFVLVDNSDYQELNQWKWHAKRSNTTFYAVRKKYIRTFKGKEEYEVIYMSRLIMSPEKNTLVDHKNGNGLDNQRDNLRLCSKSDNLLNRGPQKNNSSGHKNIGWHTQDKMWRVTFVKQGKKFDVGLFHDIKDAIIARDKAVTRVNGEFARTESF